jgi:hypothetical protein
MIMVRKTKSHILQRNLGVKDFDYPRVRQVVVASKT